MRGGEHERALKVGVEEGVVPDGHERGRVRQLGADSPDGSTYLERAREVRVALQEVIWDVCHRRVGELPARLRAARSAEIRGLSRLRPRISPRSDGAPLHSRHRIRAGDNGDAGRERGVGVRRQHHVPFTVPEGGHDRAREASEARREARRNRRKTGERLPSREGVGTNRRDRGWDHERALEATVTEGAIPDRHERGRLRKVEARQLGVVEGTVTDRRDRGRNHERAPKVNASKGLLPDRHERGRLRKVEACKLGVGEGGGTDRLEQGRARQVQTRELGVGEGEGADGLHGRPHLERAREAPVMAGSASSQHASAPLGATAHLFNPGGRTGTRETPGGNVSSSGVSFT
eukprot:scaffold92848_cov63-Phaeocystis_antarctica.AAC.1